ncbi:MAG: hypothetical protein GF418_14420 [Chitinivibrionales bacterium]|nr:hypothetical protein [Chitinivibrionales bacterium]MBD3396815.1 hypothetical protein [Chitinivibrionales bacterium]
MKESWRGNARRFCMKSLVSTRDTFTWFFVALLAARRCASAVEVTVSEIRDPAIAVAPRVYNNTLVYQDFSSGNYRFIAYELYGGTTDILNNNGQAYFHPFDFGGDVLAWIEYKMTYGDPGGGMFKASGPGPIPIPVEAGYSVKALATAAGSVSSVTQDTSYKECLAADAGRIVWSDYRHFSPGDTTVELYIHDIAEGNETRLTNAPGYKAHMDIQGNRIVWQDYRNKATTGINADIYLCTLPSTQETAVCIEGSYQDQPAVYGDFVVWQDYRNAESGGKNADIYMKNLSSGAENAVCTDPAYQGSPAIYGDYIVWQDYRNATPSDTGNADIYMFDLSSGTEQAITLKAGYQGPPCSDGNKVVWYDYADGKIYLAQLGKADGLREASLPVSFGVRRSRDVRTVQYDIRGRVIRNEQAMGVYMVRHISRTEYITSEKTVVLRSR